MLGTPDSAEGQHALPEEGTPDLGRRGLRDSKTNVQVEGDAPAQMPQEGCQVTDGDTRAGHRKRGSGQGKRSCYLMVPDITS